MFEVFRPKYLNVLYDNANHKSYKWRDLDLKLALSVNLTLELVLVLFNVEWDYVFVQFHGKISVEIGWNLVVP